MRRRELLLRWALLPLLAAVPKALAHRSHVTLTRLALNTRAGTWEWTHQVHYHDAVVALGWLLPGRDVDPVSAEGRARLAFELDRTLRFTGPDGKRLEPSTAGGELDGDSLVVYQEMPAPALRGAYTVTSSFLHQMFDDAVNNVSVEFGEQPQILRLTPYFPSGTFMA
jgi:hypothetical protein